MDLPNLFTHHEETQQELIICVLLTDDTVQSLLLSVSTHATRILKRSAIKNYADASTAVLRTDESLQELGEQSENINQVLYGLPDNWVSQDQISGHKKELLQKITNELSLQPQGFVLQSEALYQHYISQHNHFSAILLSFTHQSISVMIVTQGKVQLTETVGRSNNVAADVTEALSRFVEKHQGTYLPARIVCASFVHSDAELADYQQKLVDVQWPDSIPFVQQPTVDVMRPELAISLISQQAGQALAVQMGGDMKSKEKPMSSQSDDQQQGESDNETAVDQSVVSTPDSNEIPKVAANDSESSSNEGVANVATASSFGVPIKSEILDEEHQDETPASNEATKVSGQFHQKTKKKRSPKWFIIGGLLAGILTLVIIAFVYTQFFSQVTAVIVPKNVTISKEVTLTLDQDATESDPEKQVIPAEEVTKSISKDVTIETTGIKIVGDKATGRVKIFNKTESDKTFPAGTVVSLGEIQFVTKDEVTVPAAVVEEKTGGNKTDYGEADVDVEAYVIGVEGNIDEGKTLTVADFDESSYEAINEDAFANGSSREVRVVAEEDVAAALAKAKEEILEQANAAFQRDSGNGQYILETDQIDVGEVSYSAELENEADNLTATVGATVTAIAYKSSDLQPIAAALLESEIPDGYQVSSEDPQILSSPNDNESDSAAITLSANITTVAEPVLDDYSLKEDIAGKLITEAQSTLQGRSSIETATIVFYPNWSSQIVRKVPKNIDRIDIQKAIKE